LQIKYNIVYNTDLLVDKLKYSDAFKSVFEDMDKRDLDEFIEDWHNDLIPGGKVTITLLNENNQAVGALRLWQSPYRHKRWFIEGLQVIKTQRQKGYGKMLVLKAIEVLERLEVNCLYAHIYKKNKSSINLHKSIGFRLKSKGCVNSYNKYDISAYEYIYTISEV